WLLAHFTCGSQMNVVHDLHLKHGPTVQIGPREVSFGSETGPRDIYSSSTKCSKPPMYFSMGHLGVFSMI
ncbi:hypothetical protein K469DRAFT_538124, partial [Zopfia rhizophila CBS 207.26]